MKRTIEIHPQNAEPYLRFAYAAILKLKQNERAAAFLNGRRLLDGLFSLVGDDIPLSDDEQETLAAFEWSSVAGEITPHLLARIKRAILNVAVARVFAGVAAKWSIRRNRRAAGIATTKKKEAAA